MSQAKLVLFALRLGTARLLGYRLVWTIHQILPHESVDRRLDRRAARLLARACDVLIAHDRGTASRARAELSPGLKEIAIIPHGSYVGVYSGGRPRSAVRTALGLREDSFVFLCFGELRAHKEIELLLAAFSSVRSATVRLVVAGNPREPSLAAAVRAASARDERFVSMLQFVPEKRVAELFRASDAAVLPRGEEGTSGSLVLALSMGLPVVAADVPTIRDLTRGEAAGWLFRPHDASSLCLALEQASTNVDEARARGRRALAFAEELDWAAFSRDLANHLRRVAGGS